MAIQFNYNPTHEGWRTPIYYPHATNELMQALYDIVLDYNITGPMDSALQQAAGILQQIQAGSPPPKPGTAPAPTAPTQPAPTQPAPFNPSPAELAELEAAITKIMQTFSVTRQQAIDMLVSAQTPAGEPATPDQINSAVQLIMDTFGLSKEQAIDVANNSQKITTIETTYKVSRRDAIAIYFGITAPPEFAAGSPEELNKAIDDIARVYGVSRDVAAKILRGEIPIPTSNVYEPPAPPGFAWAFDPLTGQRTLVDTSPLDPSQPLEGWKWVLDNPDDPTSGHWVFLPSRDILDDPFKGVPSSVIPWLQTALEAGGDLNTVPDGPMRAWVQFLMAQAGREKQPGQVEFGLGIPGFGTPSQPLSTAPPQATPVQGTVPAPSQSPVIVPEVRPPLTPAPEATLPPVTAPTQPVPQPGSTPVGPAPAPTVPPPTEPVPVVTAPTAPTVPPPTKDWTTPTEPVAPAPAPVPTAPIEPAPAPSPVAPAPAPTTTEPVPKKYETKVIDGKTYMWDGTKWNYFPYGDGAFSLPGGGLNFAKGGMFEVDEASAVMPLAGGPPKAIIGEAGTETVSVTPEGVQAQQPALVIARMSDLVEGAQPLAVISPPSMPGQGASPPPQISNMPMDETTTPPPPAMPIGAM